MNDEQLLGFDVLENHDHKIHSTVDQLKQGKQISQDKEIVNFLSNKSFDDAGNHSKEHMPNKVRIRAMKNK